MGGMGGNGRTALASLGEAAGLEGLRVSNGGYKTGRDAAVVEGTRNVGRREGMGVEDEEKDDEGTGKEHVAKPAKGRRE
jgi:hypothetical protein